MKIVIDTKVVLSAFFFGGPPQAIIEAVARGAVAAYATREIVEEYRAAVAQLASRNKRGLRKNLLVPFTARLRMIEATPKPATCRNLNDDKFLSCALDAEAFYIVDDDKNLCLRHGGRNVRIMVAEGLCRLLELSSL
jgi:putative PIN family toxin of toxin-antitoxin system